MPIFPGESDVDQLFHIMRCMGALPDKFRDLAETNPLFVGVKVRTSVAPIFLLSTSSPGHSA